jgi:transcriptional regulator with XRE-family HTH domain
MKDRISEFLRRENKTSANFAEEIGVQPSAVSHILAGRNKPSLDFVLKMLNKYRFLSVEWLLFGKGGMYNDPQLQTLFDQVEVPGTENKPPIQDNELLLIPGEGKRLKGEHDKSSGDLPAGDPRRLKRIVWFYDDNSFAEYFPE